MCEPLDRFKYSPIGKSTYPNRRIDSWAIYPSIWVDAHRIGLWSSRTFRRIDRRRSSRDTCCHCSYRLHWQRIPAADAWPLRTFRLRCDESDRIATPTDRHVPSPFAALAASSLCARWNSRATNAIRVWNFLQKIDIEFRLIVTSSAHDFYHSPIPFVRKIIHENCIIA